MPKFKRQTTPKMIAMHVKTTEADAMTAKKNQVINVQRKVVEKNITPHPAKYNKDRKRKMNI